jgi:hypothetical protein
MATPISNSIDFFSTLPPDMTISVLGFLSLRKILDLKHCCKRFKKFIEAQSIAEMVLRRDYGLSPSHQMSPYDQLQLINVSTNYIRKKKYTLLADNLTKSMKKITLPIGWKVGRENYRIEVDKHQRLGIEREALPKIFSERYVFLANFKEITYYNVVSPAVMTMATINFTNNLFYFYLNMEPSDSNRYKPLLSIEISKLGLVFKEGHYPDTETLISLNFETPQLIVEHFLNLLIPQATEARYFDAELFNYLFSSCKNAKSFRDLIHFLKGVYPAILYPELYEKNDELFSKNELNLLEMEDNLWICQLIMESLNAGSRSQKYESFCQALLMKLFSKSFRIHKDGIKSVDIIKTLLHENLFECRNLTVCPQFFKDILNEEMEKLLQPKVKNPYPGYAFDALMLNEEFFANAECKPEFKDELFPMRRQAIINVVARFT